MLTDTDLDDIGLPQPGLGGTGKAKTEPTGSSSVPGLASGPTTLVPGSVTAKALLRVWSGAAVSVIDSPPGAGKTQLVSEVVSHLVHAARLRVVTATPTRYQAVSLAHRLVANVDPAKIEVSINGLEPGVLPGGLYGGHRSMKVAASAVQIRTLRSCEMSPPQDFDVMVVDEAYQATFASVAAAAAKVPQLLLVGDPGQIGPVVTVDTSVWERMPDAPHRRAPEVFKSRDDAAYFSIRESYRLGPRSVAAVAPLYDFEFVSARPPRTARLVDGRPLPEITAIEVAVSDDADNELTMRAVADRAAALVSATLTGPGIDGDGNPVTLAWDATPADVAVAVSRNSQVSIITGLLAERGHIGDPKASNITVGTADRLQGGQWPLVVALDPAAAAGSENEYAMSLGRLGVMISRHTHHLTWLSDASWPEVFAGRTNAAVRGAAVRRTLCRPATGAEQ